MGLSRTLLENPGETVELGNTNAWTEVKRCLFLIYFVSRNSLP